MDTILYNEAILWLWISQERESAVLSLFDINKTIGNDEQCSVIMPTIVYVHPYIRSARLP